MYRNTKNIKNIKSKKYKNTKNTWVPAMSAKMKKRAKHKKAKNSRKGTSTRYFTQSFQMMYRDSTKNQIKKQGASVISLCELVY